MNHIIIRFKGDEIRQQSRKFILKQALFPLVAFVCAIGFTVEDIEYIFDADVSTRQSTIDICLLALWGFLNALVYAYVTSVYKIIRECLGCEKDPMLEFSQSPYQNSDLLNNVAYESMSSGSFYYHGSFELNQGAVEVRQLEEKLNESKLQKSNGSRSNNQQ